MVADSSSIRNQFTYPVYAAMLFSTFSFIHAFTEAFRFEGNAKIAFVVGKILFGVLGYIAVYQFYRRPFRDGLSAYFFGVMIVYTLYFMWLAPLYEVSYLQCAIGAAFVKVRSRNLFMYAFGLGLAGIYATYLIQDQLQWTTPPASRLDWIFITVIFFALAWLIQNFAIRSFRNEEDRLSRLGLVGTEASMLLREVESRLQRPLELSKSLPEGDMRDLVRTIQTELKMAQNTLRSFRAKTGASIELTECDLCELWREAAERLSSRLGDTKLTYPESAVVFSDSEILRSVFFNLLLNTLESAEADGRALEWINIEWRDRVIYYSDGGTIAAEKLPRTDDKGLGLKLIREDLKRLNVDFGYGPVDGLTVTRLRFGDA